MMKRRYPPNFAKTIGPATGKELEKVPIDKDVKLPAVIQAAIARGEAAFRTVERKARRKKPRAGASPSFVTSVVDKKVQDRRDRRLEAKAKQAKGKRGQPPRLARSRVARIVVDRLLAEGVPDGTCRDSQMNRLAREWLNDKAASSRDRAKSRRKQLSEDAMRDVLNEIK
jgi:hypothetical protein